MVSSFLNGPILFSLLKSLAEVNNSVEKIRRLYNGSHLMNWEMISRPLHRGGLVLGSFKH